MMLRVSVLTGIVAALFFVQSVAAATRETLGVDGASITVESDDALRPVASELRDWVSSGARTVARFYGRFPAKQLSLHLDARPGRPGVGGGVTTSSNGAEIEIGVGTAITREALADDWVLVHEMVHLALPEVGRRHNWLAEGLATYIEGIARAQAGTRSALDVWQELERSLPQGLPKVGEGGLDRTHTWGARTGAERCSVCRRMSRSVNNPPTSTTCATR